MIYSSAFCLLVGEKKVSLKSLCALIFTEIEYQAIQNPRPGAEAITIGGQWIPHTHHYYSVEDQYLKLVVMGQQHHVYSLYPTNEIINNLQ